MAGERVLVIGGAGYLGSRLIRRIASTATYATFRQIPAGLQQGVRPVACDLSVPGWTRRLPDAVTGIVWAAQSNEYRSFPDGARDMCAVNVSAFLELLEWARTHLQGRFVYLSTGSVYRPDPSPRSEDDPCEPASFYAATKLAAEFMLREYRLFFRSITLRVFTPYGPGQEGKLVSNLIRSIRTGTPIEIRSAPPTLLAPIFVDDCLGIVREALRSDRFDQAVYNVGAPEPCTIEHLIRTIEAELGMTADVVRAGSGGALSVVPSVSRLLQTLPDLRWTPLSDGIRRMVQPPGLEEPANTAD